MPSAPATTSGSRASIDEQCNASAQPVSARHQTRAREAARERTRREYDRLLLSGPLIRISRDFGACAPFTSAGRAYDLGLYYRAELGSTPTLRFVTYRLTSDYVWQLWTTSEPFTALTPGEWVRQAFRTEPVPAGTIALSFGLRLESAGAVNVDDFDGAPVEALE